MVVSYSIREERRHSLSPNQIPLRRFVKTRELLGLPAGIFAEFLGQNFGDFWGHANRCLSVEEQDARAAGEDVFDGAGHFHAHGPNDFGRDVWQFGIELLFQRGIIGDEFANGYGV